MKAPLTIDPSGGIALQSDDEAGSAQVELVDRDGFLVFTGTQPFDAVDAIMAARADRENACA